MPDKLTDNEIVKALKLLLELVLVEGCLQRAKTISNALDLINRQKEEKEALINGQETLQKYIADLQAENEKWQGGYMTQKQEISNLEIELKAMRGAANSYKAENERLRNHIQEGIDLAKQTPEMIAITKAEAYKECIEKVKAYYKETRFDYDADNLCEELNNLLKELVGEDK